MLKRRLLASACVVMMPISAHAQDRTAPDGASSAEQSAADGSEIIVTATLRKENLQKVPIAVTAVSGDALEKRGINDLKSLDNVTPSFSLQTANNESGTAQIRIRGIGTSGNNIGLESAVGIFLDGVYLSRPSVALGDLVDLEQVEVLRGPQGTLFGRNTSSGALNIRTHKPALDQVEGFANLTYGNFDHYSVQMGASVPVIADKLAVRVSGAWRKRDGWVVDAAGDDNYNRNRYLVRGQLYWEPNPNVSLRLIADYSKSNENCCAPVVIKEGSYVAAGIYTAVGLPANGGVAISGPEAVKQRRAPSLDPFNDDQRQWGLSGELNWQIGDAALTAITSYRDYRSTTTSDSDVSELSVLVGPGAANDPAGRLPGYTRVKTFSQELRLAGSAFDDRLDYLVGAYFVDERIEQLQSFAFGPDFQRYISTVLKSVGVPGTNPARDIFAGGVEANGTYANNLFHQSGQNWSLFTNNTFHVTDAIGFNFGLRYSNDRKRGTFDQISASSDACSAVAANLPNLPASLRPLGSAVVSLTCFPLAAKVGAFANAPVEFDRKFKDEQLVYTLKLTAELGSNTNSYASYSRGYKAGGFNLDPTAAIGGASPAFKAEKVSAYELGIKSQLLDRALTVNLALFHQDFSDFQLLEFTGVQYLTFNVPKVKSTGAELEFTARVSPEFTLTGGLTYTDARYPKDCGGPNPAPQVATLCGQVMQNAPEWVTTMAADYSKDIGSKLNFGFNASARMESDRRTAPQALLNVAAGTGTEGPTLNQIKGPYDIQDGNVKVNLRAGLGDQDGLWRVELWANNVFNVQTWGIVSNTPLRGVGTLPGPINAGGASVSRMVFLQEPRTYGVTLKTKF
jgi:iron complex outermembrane receptor protein